MHKKRVWYDHSGREYCSTSLEDSETFFSFPITFHIMIYRLHLPRYIKHPLYRTREDSSLTSIATMECSPATFNYERDDTVLQIIVFSATHFHDFGYPSKHLSTIRSLTIHDDGFSQYRTCTYVFSGHVINFFLCSGQQKKILTFNHNT